MRSSRVAAILVLATVSLVALGIGVDGVLDDDPDGEELLERAIEADVEGVHGVAVIEYAGPNGTIETTEEVWLRPGQDRYRGEIIASNDPAHEADVVVSNGSVAWFYDEAAGEATQYDLEEVGIVTAYERDHYERLLETFDAAAVEGTSVAGREAYRVRLTPPEDVASIDVLVGETEYQLPVSRPATADLVLEAHEVWIDAETGYPLKERTELRAPDGSSVVTSRTFETVEFDAVPDERFEFEPPAGAEVVDDSRTGVDTYDSVAAASAATPVELPAVEDLAIPDRFDFQRVTVLEHDGETTASLVFEADGEELAVTVGERRHDLDRGVERTVDGRESRIVHFQTGPTLQWNCGENGYQVFGVYDEDELVAIAESVDCGPD